MKDSKNNLGEQKAIKTIIPGDFIGKKHPVGREPLKKNWGQQVLNCCFTNEKCYIFGTVKI